MAAQQQSRMMANQLNHGGKAINNCSKKLRTGGAAIDECATKWETKTLHLMNLHLDGGMMMRHSTSAPTECEKGQRGNQQGHRPMKLAMAQQLIRAPADWNIYGGASAFISNMMVWQSTNCSGPEEEMAAQKPRGVCARKLTAQQPTIALAESKK
jgi:hypothetical protein